MSYSQKTASETSFAHLPDAVWASLTTVKQVVKADGTIETFNREKIAATIQSLLSACRIPEKLFLEPVLATIFSRLQRQFDGTRIPHVRDVREAITSALIDHQLAFVAKRFLDGSHFATNSNEPHYGHGVSFERYFTKAGVHPYDMIVWEKRDATITNEKGKVVFEQKGVEVPKSWSQTATNVVVSKYFRGKIGDPDREYSAKQLIGRVATTIANWGRKDGYFQTAEDAQVYEDELTHILINQMAAFNSPVWFNVGLNPHPQCSACFINSVQDDMRSILHLTYTEGMLFKGGSGTGTNLSTLRSSKEYMGGSNGRASGPISFMKGFDAFAGVIKSGGKTRRAAKMVILNADHPDIMDFIDCKLKEEKKAWALMDAGYDGSIDGEAYGSIYFQNANNSVRVTDEFMKAVENNETWTTHEVVSGKPSVSYPAREVFRKLADAAWQCGDPGMQYDTTVNTWHTCKKTGRINASNPCSEYMFLDDSACNLASLNLMKFRKEVNGEMVFDVAAFKKANEVIITAMEIIVGNSSYPTPAIERNSFDYRPLGIGYANLGALLMAQGLAYESEEGRHLAAAITALQNGICYDQSARIAEKMGAFAGFERNRESCLDVMHMHRDHAYRISSDGVPTELLFEARRAWDAVISHATQFGLRNAQISVLAPTGTIAFLMDCDTTGIEPDIALVKYKWLVGGGMLKIVNQTVSEALTRLKYTDEQKKDIMDYIDKNDTIEGAPHLKDEHLSVFDCAFKPAKGKRSIHFMAHLQMMAAVQPFISGAISKTVNMPSDATVEDVEKVYMTGWKLGLKAVAIYRDGSKRQQALTTSKEKDSKKSNEAKLEAPKAESAAVAAPAPVVTNIPRRRRLPDERRALTHKFTIANHDGYVTVGLYDDGTPGEIFIKMAKEGTVISGLMDSFSTAVSIGLQYGVPLDVLVNKFVHVRFEPSGYTSNPNIRIAKSIVDYMFRWIAMKFLSPEAQQHVGINRPIETGEFDTTAEKTAASASPAVEEVKQPTLFAGPTPVAPVASSASSSFNSKTTFDNQSDAPACDTCGSITVRNGACYKCLNCGSTTGCS